jgi:hypothetical protein
MPARAVSRGEHLLCERSNVQAAARRWLIDVARAPSRSRTEKKLKRCETPG